MIHASSTCWKLARVGALAAAMLVGSCFEYDHIRIFAKIFEAHPRHPSLLLETRGHPSTMHHLIAVLLWVHVPFCAILCCSVLPCAAAACRSCRYNSSSRIIMFGWCILALWLATVIPVTVAVEGTVASLRGPQSKVGLLLVHFACRERGEVSRRVCKKV